METFFKGQSIYFGVEYFNADGTLKNLTALPNFAVILYQYKNGKKLVCKKANILAGELALIWVSNTLYKAKIPSTVTATMDEGKYSIEYVEKTIDADIGIWVEMGKTIDAIDLQDSEGKGITL